MSILTKRPLCLQQPFIEMHSVKDLHPYPRLVNLVSCIPLQGLLEFKAVFVAKMFYDLSSSALNFNSNYNDKDLKMISKWLVLLLACVWNLKLFHITRNCFQTHQNHSRDIINIVLSSSSQWLIPHCKLWILAFFPLQFMVCLFHAWLGHNQSPGKKSWSVTYSMDLRLG